MKTSSHSRGRRAAAALVATALGTLGTAASAATLRVPADVATIQGAIDAAQTGDVVSVAPGTYDEAIDFGGKAITVESTGGAAATIIDAQSARSVVRFHTHETRQSVLSGFTLRNGVAVDFPGDGGGVQIYRASPTVRDNIVQGNSGCDGNGIAAEFSRALISGNHVLQNRTAGCAGGAIGGGVYIGGKGAVELYDNVIEYNESDDLGGGLGLDAAGTPTIARNTIRMNRSTDAGGGIGSTNASTPVIADNLIYQNTSVHGGGILMSIASGSGALIVNNTLADNKAKHGSEMLLEGFAGPAVVANNIFRTSLGQYSVICSPEASTAAPLFEANDIFSTDGAEPHGTCAAVVGQQGNIAADPRFAAGKGDMVYALGAGSPAIDAGLNAQVAGQKKDLLGHARIVDGKGDGSAVVDMGAFEYGAH